MGRKYTWAYINTTAEGDVAPAEGEFGSIQTKDFDGGFKGHANFRYLTSSTTAPTSPLTTHVVKLTGDFAMSGDIFCTGSIYARNYYIKNVGFMDLTGSTKFGDDLGDTHNFKGDVILDTTSKLYFHDEAGGENIYANSDGHLEINAGSILDLTAPTIDINGSTEVQIDAATFDVNGTTAVTIDCTDTSNGISIGTATSAVPISIGHTTSETTVNDNLTVTGDAEVTGDLTVTGESTFNDKVTINQDDGQQGLRINQTGDGIGLDIDASTVTGKAAVKVTTGRTSGGSGFYLNANSVTSGYGLGIDANGLNGANAAALYIQSEINAQQAGHLIRIKNTDDTNDQMQGITIENAAAPDGNYRDFVIKGLSPNDGMRFQADHEGVIVGPSTTRRGKLHIYSSTSDDIGAMIAINSDQAASDRKPQVAFFNSGARKFTVGSDGSDSMKFKMGTTAIDTGTFLEANTSGELIKLGDDTPALNDVLTWNGSKAIWEPNSLTSATQLVNNAGDAVISSVTDVEITLDSNDNSSTHNYFRIIDGDGQTTLSFGEQGQMVMRGLSGSATEGAKLFMSASNSDAANSAEITFRKTHFADGGTFSAGDNLGTLRFQGSDAGIPDTSSIVIVGEVAAGSIPDASAESWSQGAQMGAELKFSLKQTGTNNFNESLILDGLGAQIGGRLYGPTGDHFVLSSDKDFQIRIDEDGGGSHSFQVFNGAGASMLHVLENGATNIVGDLTVAGHDIKNSDNEVCITMDADQRVGIGGVAPAYKLDIDGDIRVRGNDIRDSGAGVAIRFDGSSNTSILGSLNAGTVNASGQLTLQNTLNAAGDVDDPNDFALLIHHNASTNGTGPGIAFQATNDAGQVGAAIIHEKTDSFSHGHLKFYTKQANTDGTAPELVMTMTHNGNVEVENALYIGGGFGSTGVTINSAGAISANGNIIGASGIFTSMEVGGGFGSTGVSISSGGAISANGDILGAAGTFTSMEVGGGFGSTGIDLNSNGNINTNGDILCGDITIGDTIQTISGPLYIKSEAGVIVHLDDDGGDSSYFRVYSGGNNSRFEVDEDGKVGINLSSTGGDAAEKLHVRAVGEAVRVRLETGDGHDTVYTGYQGSTQKMAVGYDDGLDRASFNYGGMSSAGGLDVLSTGELWAAEGGSFAMFNTNATSRIYLKRHDPVHISDNETIGAIHFQASEQTSTVFTNNAATILADPSTNWNETTSNDTHFEFWCTPSGATQNQRAMELRAVDTADCLRIDGNVDADAFFSEGHQYPSTTEESEFIEQGDCLALIDGELCRTSSPMQKNVAGIAWYRMSDKKCLDRIDGGSPFEPYSNACTINPKLISDEANPNFGKYFIIDETGSTLIFDSLEHWNQSKDRSKEFSKKWIDSLGNKYDLVERQDVTEEWTPTEDFKRVWKTISLGDSRQFTDISVETNSVQKMSGFKVCDEGGSISAGDLLCTSSKTGRLMKQPDDLMHSYTVAKAMEDVTFDADGNADGVYGYVYCG